MAALRYEERPATKGSRRRQGSPRRAPRSWRSDVVVWVEGQSGE
jgi:hypothetical protein